MICTKPRTLLVLKKCKAGVLVEAEQFGPNLYGTSAGCLTNSVLQNAFTNLLEMGVGIIWTVQPSPNLCWNRQASWLRSCQCRFEGGESATRSKGTYVL